MHALLHSRPAHSRRPVRLPAQESGYNTSFSKMVGAFHKERKSRKSVPRSRPGNQNGDKKKPAKKKNSSRSLRKAVRSAHTSGRMSAGKSRIVESFPRPNSAVKRPQQSVWNYCQSINQHQKPETNSRPRAGHSKAGPGGKPRPASAFATSSGIRNSRSVGDAGSRGSGNQEGSKRPRRPASAQPNLRKSRSGPLGGSSVAAVRMLRQVLAEEGEPPPGSPMRGRLRRKSRRPESAPLHRHPGSTPPRHSSRLVAQRQRST